jgi:tetratricopeptide (TPR) repeat protein
MKRNLKLQQRVDAILETFINKNKYKPAIEDLTALERELGKRDLISYYLGVCYANINDYARAADCLKDLSSSAELTIIQLIQCNMLLGFIYTELSSYSKAEKCFKKALEINPDSSMSFSALGYVYFQAKKYDLAIFNFKKAIQIDPNNASAHNNLGYTYAELGINLSEALNECRKAVALNPSSAAYRDSLGWCLHQTNDFNGAVKELEEALNYKTKNQDIIYEHLNTAIKRRDRR